MDARREIDVTRFRWVAGFGRVCRGMGVLATMAIAGPAAAHSELRGSIPATGAVLDCAPEAISLQFSEQVQLTALRLYRVDGWSAPIEWSGVNVSAWSASGLLGRCFRVLVAGIPERCAV